MKTATANLFLDQRKGQTSIKVVITHNRIKRLYATGVFADAETYAKLKTQIGKDRPDGKIKDPYFIETWAKLCNDFDKSKMFANIPLGKLTIARKIVSDLGINFDFETYKNKFDNWGKIEDKTDDTDVVLALNKKAETMRKQDRVGHAGLFELAAKSLIRFVASFNNSEKKEFGFTTLKNVPLVIRFENITTDFLDTYETWALHYGKMGQGKNGKPQPATSTTIGIYMRHLRVVFNDAIKAGIVSRQNYPFGQGEYVVPAGANPKVALPIEDIGKIMSYECRHEKELECRDFWVLSYLCNGMNFNDILRLKIENIDLKGQKFVFVRKKTARTTKGNQKKIIVKLNPVSVAIIEKYGKLNGRGTDYVFRVLSDRDDEKEIIRKSKNFINSTDGYMRRIAKALGIEGKTTTKVCRHSFSTILAHSEAPLLYISQSLGHSSTIITQAYLDSFSDEKTQSYLSNLLPKE